jgi:hypothetical protein
MGNEKINQDFLQLAATDLQKVIKPALEMLVHRGFRFPIRCVAVTANGSVFAYEISEQRQPKELVTYMVSEGERFPINLLVVDCGGESETVQIRGLEASGTVH